MRKSVRRMIFVCPPFRVYVYVTPTLTDLVKIRVMIAFFAILCVFLSPDHSALIS
jgi:hypothetical protein